MSVLLFGARGHLPEPPFAVKQFQGVSLGARFRVLLVEYLKEHALLLVPLGITVSSLHCPSPWILENHACQLLVG